MVPQVAVVVKNMPANAGDVTDLGSILFIFLFILFSIMVFSQDIKYSSLCDKVGLHCLSTLSTSKVVLKWKMFIYRH